MILVILLPFVILFFVIAFIVIEALAAISFNKARSRVVLYSIFCCLVLAWGFDDGVVPNPLLSPHAKTVPNLIAQAQGEEVYWTESGKRPTLLDRINFNTRNFAKRCPTYALRKLGAMGKDAVAAEQPLIELLNTTSDYDTGDGVISYRTDVVLALAMMESAKAVPEIIRMLKDDSFPLADDQRRRNLDWHEPGNELRYADVHCGPSGIVHSLMVYPPKYDDEIASGLANVLLELQATEGSSEWTIVAIKDALKYFDGTDSKSRIDLREIVVSRAY